MKIALHNLLSCGGCNLIFFLEELSSFLSKTEIVFWPEVKDESLEAVYRLPEKTLDLGLLCGSVKTLEHEKIAMIFREKSRFLIVVGACALLGGIPGLNWLYKEGPRPIPAIVNGDLLIPGCPPEGKTIRWAFEKLLSSEAKRPSVPSETPLCQECPRERQPFRLRGLKRLYESAPQERSCYLESGVVCAGVVTQAGCGAACIRAGYPCFGCYGPPKGLEAPGERLLSALTAAFVPAKGGTALEEWPDPVGTLYRFTLAQHPLPKKRYRRTHENH